MPYTVTIETLPEFDARHGGKSIRVGEQIIWPDGATAAVASLNARAEPPERPFDLLRIKRAYQEAAIKRFEQQFYALKAEYANQTALATKYSNLPAASADAPQILRDLRSTVEQHRAELAKIDEALAQTPEAQAEQRRQDLLDQHRLAVNALLNSINEVTL